MSNILISKSGLVTLQISEDKLSAWLEIKKHAQLLDEQEILDLIEESRIRYGFEEALHWMVKESFEKDFNKPFPIAMAKHSAATPQLNYHFDTENIYHPQRAWTFEELQSWSYVEKGAVLADYTLNLFSDGGSIYNIFGEIASLSSETPDLGRFAGRNVINDRDQNRLIAAKTGYPYLEDEKICILDNLEYPQDLANITTPLNLACSIHIKGSVRNSQLLVLKDVTIEGNLEASGIYTEGDLIVKGCIRDCNMTEITVLGDLKVHGIDNSRVICNGNLSFESSITNSKVIAERSVVGNPDLSNISNSHVHSAGFMEISSAGNPDKPQTELEITISPFIKERMNQLTKILVKLKENQVENQDAILCTKDELTDLETRLSEDISSHLKEAGQIPHYIRIFHDIYPGTYLRVLKSAQQIKKHQANGEYME